MMGVMSFKRYVALGDSFTEGVGDNDPTRPNGLRGWADRVAYALAGMDDEFTYANLAIRGRKLPQIIDEQVDAAIALGPDLVTIHGGGNDILRPKVDIDALAHRYDEAIGKLVATGATVAMFTLFDPGSYGIYKATRGRMALFNEWAREISDKHGTVLVDQWRMRDVDLAPHMDTDRMHLNPAGHQYMATQVLNALGVEHALERLPVEPMPVLARKEALIENARWTREFLGPWIGRRLTGKSSGDTVSPKHPTWDRLA